MFCLPYLTRLCAGFLLYSQTKIRMQKKIEIIDGYGYCTGQKLVHTITDSDDALIVFTITFLGQDIVKRCVAISGVVELYLSDILDGIKKNVYEFLPLSVFEKDSYETLDISYSYTKTGDLTPTNIDLSIYVFNSIISPETFEQTLDFLTPKKYIEVDKQFEIGVSFAGEKTIRFQTDTGDVDVLTGAANTISYLSLRGLNSVVSTMTEKGDQVGMAVDSTTKILGFEDDELGAFSGVYGTIGGNYSLNYDLNVLSFTASGIVTGLVVGGTQITFTTQDTTGKIIGIGTDGNVYPVEGYTAVATSDIGLYLEHKFGCTGVVGGGYVLNSTLKEGIIEKI